MIGRDEKINEHDDFIESLSFVGSKRDIKKLEIIYMSYIKDDISESFELTIHYNVYFANACETVRVRYFNVKGFRVNDRWSNFPSHILYHNRLEGWEGLNYHVFDIDANGDYFDTISFYCRSFEILK